MFCVHCGTAMQGAAVACVSCGSTASQLKTASREVGQKVKSASQDALGAFKAMAVNPVGGLPTAYQALGKQRALAAGLVFGVIFTLVLGVTITIQLMKVDLTPNLKGFVTMILLGVVPFLSIAGASLIVRKLFRGDGGSVGGDFFLAGAALLPIAVVLLATALLGSSNIEVILLLAVFAFCYSMNMLFVGSSRLSKIPDALVTPAVAVMLMLTIWLSKIILVSTADSTASQLLGFLF
jgi:hypothetical protein